MRALSASLRLTACLVWGSVLGAEAGEDRPLALGTSGLAVSATLSDLETSERTGVEATRIRIGVDLRSGKAVFERLEAALAAGVPQFHGRRIELVPISDPGEIEAQRIFALLAASELGLRESDEGLPVLIPIAALDDRVRADEARDITPTRRDQAEALLKAAPADAAILADIGGRALLPGTTARRIHDAATVDPSTITPLPSDLIVLVDLSAWARLAEAIPGTTRVHAVGAEVPTALPTHSRRGVRFVITDPSAGPNVDATRPPVERFAQTAAALLKLALSTAGRDLTRGSLLRAFDAIWLDGPDWPNLDYRRYPLTGRRSVQLLRSE